MSPKAQHTPGPLTCFVGNSDGRGLVRIETGPEAPVAGEHIASLTRNRVADAEEIVRRWNAHEALVDACRDVLAAIASNDSRRELALQQAADRARAALAKVKP